MKGKGLHGLERQHQQRQRELELSQQQQQQQQRVGSSLPNMTGSPFTFRRLYEAWLDCRRRKRRKQSSLAFEQDAERHLQDLARELTEGVYQPLPSFCFIARNDKHREVFAADFRDRVVHHLFIREIEPAWERVFIYDSHACRRGHGTHAAVKRAQTFARQVSANGTRRAWFLQLDIAAFFPSIDRHLLLEMVLSKLTDPAWRRLAEILILHDPSTNPVFTCSREKWRAVPPQKSLFGVAAGKGLPIGNLTSQFFANIYLNPLDQFIKHELKARFYCRYVDDLLMMHEDPAILRDWAGQIEKFLNDRLQLKPNPRRTVVQPVTNGINFLGFIIRPSHLLVRRKTVTRCRKKIEGKLATMKTTIPGAVHFGPDQFAALRSTLQSYLGIFSHAATKRLTVAIMQRNPLLCRLFRLDGHRLIRRWYLSVTCANLITQWRCFREKFHGLIFMQVGCYWEAFNGQVDVATAVLNLRPIVPRPGFFRRCGFHNRQFNWAVGRIAASKIPTLFVGQTGREGHRLMERAGVFQVCFGGAESVK